MGCACPLLVAPTQFTASHAPTPLTCMHPSDAAADSLHRHQQQQRACSNSNSCAVSTSSSVAVARLPARFSVLARSSGARAISLVDQVEGSGGNDGDTAGPAPLSKLDESELPEGSVKPAALSSQGDAVCMPIVLQQLQEMPRRVSPACHMAQQSLLPVSSMLQITVFDLPCLASHAGHQSHASAPGSRFWLGHSLPGAHSCGRNRAGA